MNTFERVALLARRELYCMFFMPTVYAVLSLFQLLNGVFFALIVYHTSSTNLTYLYQDIGLVSILIVPAVTMGAFVRERREGTFELLMTSPLSSGQIVAGKFIAYYVLVSLMMITTIQYPFVLSLMAEIDTGRVLAGLAGCLLLGGAICALGLLASALVSSQVSACLLAFTVGMSLWCSKSMSRVFTGEPIAFFRAVSLSERLAPFCRGMIDSASVVFFVLFCIASLALCVRALEARGQR